MNTVGSGILRGSLPDRGGSGRAYRPVMSGEAEVPPAGGKSTAGVSRGGSLGGGIGKHHINPTNRIGMVGYSASPVPDRGIPAGILTPGVL